MNTHSKHTWRKQPSFIPFPYSQLSDQNDVIRDTLYEECHRVNVPSICFYNIALFSFFSLFGIQRPSSQNIFTLAFAWKENCQHMCVRECIKGRGTAVSYKWLHYDLFFPTFQQMHSALSDCALHQADEEEPDIVAAGTDGHLTLSSDSFGLFYFVKNVF